jgi:putative addiction module killer protein
MKIRKTSVYKKWIKGLRDNRVRYRILAWIKRLEEGNSGDVGPVGEGISEMSIHYSSGYRAYYKNTDREIIVLLCGGDKTTQQEDIATAKRIVMSPLEEEE